MSDAKMRQFVDTNVLIYSYNKSAGSKHERAKQLLTELWQSREGCISIQVLQEFSVNVTQKVAKPLVPDAASQIISELAEWNVHEPRIDDILQAIQFQKGHRISFWGAMILASAAALQCDIVCGLKI